MPKKEDSPEYLAKMGFYRQFLTVYGKKIILDILTDSPEVKVAKIMIAERNKGEVVERIIALARQRKIPVEYTSAERISRISKNQSEDQGIVADISAPRYLALDNFLQADREKFTILALDGVTNTANIGIIIRSVAASGIDGILIPEKGCPKVSHPLVLKATAGTLFKTTIITCVTLPEALTEMKKAGATIYSLAAGGKEDLYTCQPTGSSVFVVGNESTGISSQTAAVTDVFVTIPMANRVESLNVAAAATLVAYQAARAIHRF